MGVQLAQFLLLAVGVYTAIGVPCTVFMLRRGLARLDAAAAHAPWTAKALWTPGFIALWPCMLIRTRRATGASR